MRPKKFITKPGTRTSVLNPEWIKWCYPWSWEEIYHKGLDAKTPRRMEDNNGTNNNTESR